MSNARYNEEMRLQTVKLVLKGDKSAAKIAKDLGINQNTVSRWVQEYRKQNNLPTYEEERRIRKVSIEELAAKNKELERKLKQKEKGDYKAEMRSYSQITPGLWRSHEWSRQETKRNLRRQRETDLVQTVRSVFEEFKSIYGCTKLLR